MDILNILKRESESKDEIYIYEVDNKWYAYENSAVLISQLLTGIVTLKQFINDTYEIVIRIVEVELDLLIKYRIVSCADQELKLLAQ